ncbi:S-layer homology domain-containing protein [Alkalicoccus urumqiensis]|uniref:S-layer homology domain-containing protein n=1 Tax=Alkalicoccus urumqiensis TaxID=1548213 RepID=UPI0015E6136A|nr:S-layer homology domain-containing protein [Alkalicoccus urumqiensis]
MASTAAAVAVTAPSAVTAETPENYEVDVSNPFSDVEERKYYGDPVLELTEAGIIQGRGDTTFGVGAELTRADAAILLTRVLNLEPAPEGSNSFPDVTEDDYYYAEVNAAAEAALIRGYEDGSFRPEENLTRGEMAVLLERAFPLSAVQVAPDFEDTGDNPYEQQINRVAAAGLAEGYPDGTFRPDENILREEFAVFLYREPTVQGEVRQELLRGASFSSIDVRRNENGSLVFSGQVNPDRSNDSISVDLRQFASSSEVFRGDLELDEDGNFELETDEPVNEGQYSGSFQFGDDEETVDFDVDTDTGYSYDADDDGSDSDSDSDDSSDDDSSNDSDSDDDSDSSDGDSSGGSDDSSDDSDSDDNTTTYDEDQDSATADTDGETIELNGNSINGELSVSGSDVTIEGSGEGDTIETAVVSGNNATFRNLTVNELQIEEGVEDVTLESVSDSGGAVHTFAGGGSDSITVDESTTLEGDIELTADDVTIDGGGTLAGDVIIPNGGTKNIEANVDGFVTVDTEEETTVNTPEGTDVEIPTDVQDLSALTINIGDTTYSTADDTEDIEELRATPRAEIDEDSVDGSTIQLTGTTKNIDDDDEIDFTLELGEDADGEDVAESALESTATITDDSFDAEWTLENSSGDEVDVPAGDHTITASFNGETLIDDYDLTVEAQPEETGVTIGEIAADREGTDPVAAEWSTGLISPMENGVEDGELNFNGVTLTLVTSEDVDGYTISEAESRNITLEFDASTYQTSGQQVDLLVEALEKYQDSSNEELDRFTFANDPASGGRALGITGDASEGAEDNGLTITSNEGIEISNDDSSSITQEGVDGEIVRYTAAVNNEVTGDGSLTITTWNPSAEVTVDLEEGQSAAEAASAVADALNSELDGYEVDTSDAAITFTADGEGEPEQPLRLQAVDSAVETSEGDPEVTFGEAAEQTAGVDPRAAQWNTGQFEERDNGIEDGFFRFNGVTVYITTEEGAEQDITVERNREVSLTFDAAENTNAQQIDLVIEALEAYQDSDNDHLDRFSFENVNNEGGGRALEITSSEEAGADDNILGIATSDSIVIANDGDSALSRDGRDGTASVTTAGVQNQAQATGTITITTENPSAEVTVDIREGDSAATIALKTASALEGELDGFTVSFNDTNVVFTADEPAELENTPTISASFSEDN